MDRIKELANVLAKANSAYRAGSSIMSDVEFEALEQELKQLDPTHPWFLKGVNDEAPKTRKVKLPVPMMSLNKVKTVEELVDWARGFHGEFVITPKYDGLSIGLFRNKDGILQAVTRGNGEVGQDCTQHFIEIQDAPRVDDAHEENIRGEIIFTHSNFEGFRQDHPEAKSSRNSATGLINGDFDTAKIEDYKKLSVIAYNLSRVPELNKKEQIDILSRYYTNVDAIPHTVVTLDFFTSPTCRQDLAHLFNCWRAIYPMDGLVIDVNDAQERSMAGVYSNGNPKYSIAYKDPEFTSKADVEVGEILVQLNREGVAIPVVCLKEPVSLAGAEISRISGINMQYIEDWGIAPGQEITIIRSGEVIPKIIAVGGVKIPFVEEYTSAKSYKTAYTKALMERQIQPSFPTHSIKTCPYCGSTLEWNDNHIHKVCPNEDCPERKVQAVIQFCSILGIKGFGEGNFRQLFNAGLVTYPYELFGLKISQLDKLPNWGEVSTNNLMQELVRVSSGNIPFAQIAHASGYFGGLGQKTIQLIVDAVGVNSDGIVNNKSVEELCQIDGVQEITARQFRNGLWLFYDSIISELLTPSYVVSPVAGGPLKGVVYCFTGFRDKALKEKLESLGAQVVDSLSKKVTKLVTKEANSTSTKVKKAQSLGIEVISLEELLQGYQNLTRILEYASSSN